MSDILIWFIIGIIAGAIGVALDTHRKKRLGIKDEPKAKPNESAKSRWPTDEMYKNFYRTGDRRFLYDEHYKKKGYNDFDDDDDDYDDKHKERRTKHYSQSWVSDENYEKFLRTGDCNYLWDENYKRWDDYDDDDYDDYDDDDDREYEKVRKDVKEFLEKDTPKLILP